MRKFMLFICSSFFLLISNSMNAQLLDKLLDRVIGTEQEETETSSNTSDDELQKELQEKHMSLVGNMGADMDTHKNGEKIAPQNFTSIKKEGKNYFEGWPYGRGGIWAMMPDGVTFHHAGSIFEEGLFYPYGITEKISVSTKIVDLFSHCKTFEISNEKAKGELIRFIVTGTKDDIVYQGGFIKTNSIEVAKSIYGAKQDHVNEGSVGDYVYFIFYSNKAVTLKGSCERKRVVDGVEVVSKEQYDWTLEKGSNIIKTTYLETAENQKGIFISNKKSESVPWSKKDKETPWHFVYLDSKRKSEY